MKQRSLLSIGFFCWIILSIDEDAKTIAFRRWTTHQASGTAHRPWAAHPAGTYLAPNANQIALAGFPPAWVKYLDLRSIEYMTPFLPNLTRFCPRDPRTGLNAAEWLARHFVDVKKRKYPAISKSAWRWAGRSDFRKRHWSLPSRGRST